MTWTPPYLSLSILEPIWGYVTNTIFLFYFNSYFPIPASQVHKKKILNSTQLLYNEPEIDILSIDWK